MSADSVDRRIWLEKCAGKQQFESRAMANEVSRRRNSKGKRSNVYKCDGCNKYHIGTQGKDKR